MSETAPIKWLAEPEDHDYPAAQSYLELLFEEGVAGHYVERLKAAAMSSFMAKDIFRASALSLLGISNQRVEHDRQKVAAGKSMSPSCWCGTRTTARLSSPTATTGCARRSIRLTKGH